MGSRWYVSGCITHWPALHLWRDLNYLKKVAGTRTVPIELGVHYVHPAWSQKLMTVGEFIEAHIKPQMGEDTPIGYLAQHPLFEQVYIWSSVYYQKCKSSINIVMNCLLDGHGSIPSKGIKIFHSTAMSNMTVEPNWFSVQWIPRNIYLA
jgi:hypothetical protein